MSAFLMELRDEIVPIVLQHLDLVQLSQLRRVCRQCRTWAAMEITSMPKPLAVGGTRWEEHSHTAQPQSQVLALDLSTLRWNGAVAVPALPQPRGFHGVCALPGSGIVVAGGVVGSHEAPTHQGSAIRWAAGDEQWTSLPNLLVARESAALVSLGDSRVLAIGGVERVQDSDDEEGAQFGEEPLSSVELLAPPGDAWRLQAPMPAPREAMAVGLLRSGKIIVCGGRNDENDALDSVLLFDPAANAWAELPSLPEARYCAASCVLEDGRFAVCGGMRYDSQSQEIANLTDGVIFSPERNAWSLMAATPAGVNRLGGSAAAVRGGLVCVGGQRDLLWRAQTDSW